MNKLIEKTKERIYNYAELYNHPDTIKRLSEEERDINFIIGIKGRPRYVRATVKNILKASNNTNLKVRIIVVEQDKNPINYEFFNDFDIDYIFLPQDITNTEHLHSTSLMYNVGFMFSKEAKYNMFHCGDTIVAHNFFKVLEENYLNKNFTWIQPYSEKRVRTFTYGITQNYLNDKFSGKDPSSISYPQGFGKPEKEGAPGGSILIPTDVFYKIGGYDPELFYGYTVEDSFIWGKMECLVSNGKQVPKIHNGGAIYAENPRLYLYHFQHPPAKGDNHRFKDMFTYFNTFFKEFTYKEQMDYIKHKSELFIKQREQFLKNKLPTGKLYFFDCKNEDKNKDETYL